MSIAMKVKSIAEEKNYEEILAAAYLTMGTIEGDLTQETENLFKALMIYEKLKNDKGISETYNALGCVLGKQGNYKKALQYFNLANTIAKKINSVRAIISSSSNIANIHTMNDEYLQAIAKYNEILLLCNKNGDIFQYGIILSDLAVCYQKYKNYDLSKKYYEQAISLLTHVGNFDYLAFCYINYARLCLTENNDSKYLKYTQMAYHIGEYDNLNNIVFLASASLHDYYKNVKQWDSAYKYTIIQDQVKDKIGIEKSKARFAISEMQYNDEKKHQEAKLKQQRKDFILLFVILLLTSGIIATILLLSRQRIKVKNISLEKKQLADEVEFKNKELVIHVMNVLKKNEFIMESINHLLEIEERPIDEESKSSILKIIHNIQRNSEGEALKEFELRFKEVHNDFYESLILKFPDLTPSELKLSAFLRLNLSTKEICQLTGQIPSSLDVARYRLRKKLGLSNSSTNLISFLSQF